MNRLHLPPAATSAGFTAVTTLDDALGIALGVLRLTRGQSQQLSPATETAWLLMSGAVVFSHDGRAWPKAQRSSLFDQSPSCLHVCATTEVVIEALEDTELTVYSVANQQSFESRFYQPADVPNEHRGRGQVGGACYRYVRTVFDGTRSDKNADLVLGEVVTFPGRWSSYPPHHHAQPELYHYRFTKPQGFGFSQLGDDVVQVKHGDTVKIAPGHNHAQVAAPGYGMYYAWVVRHLPENPYRGPTFEPEHSWTMQEGAAFWTPPEMADTSR